MMKIGIGFSLAEIGARASAFAPVGPHRYWRIYSYASNDASFTQIADLKVRTAAGGANLSMAGVTCTVDAAPQAGTAAEVIDGNQGTFCQLNGEFNHWFQLDFGANPANWPEINEVLINGAVGAAGRSPYHFDVQYSDNGGAGGTWATSWKTFLNVQSYTSTAAYVTSTRPTPSATARMYMWIPGRNLSSVYAWAEFIMAETFNGANAITNASMIHLASAGNGAPGNLIDGNAGTFEYNTSTAWWQRNYVDFGAGNLKDISEIRMLPRSGNPEQWQAGMDVFYGSDGDSWLSKWSTGGANGGTIVFTNDQTYSVIRNPAKILPLSGGRHRYWGLKVNAVNGGGIHGVREIGFRPIAAGATNTTGGVGKSLCSFNTGTKAPLAFDGNTGTEYASAFGTDIIAYDYGDGNEVAKPAEIAVTARGGGLAASQSMTNFDLVYSDDGFTWSVQQAGFTASGWTDGQTKTFAVA
jgi:hypothetical protein